MKFSVVVPVYNTEKYLYDCVESVLRQTHNDFELILVNDGSTDQSGKICHKYANQDARIKAYDKENSGQIETRSYGISKATGDYIVFLDSDDMLADHALETINHRIAQYGCDMVMYSYRHFVDRNEIETCDARSDARVLTQKDLCIKITGNSFYNSLCIKTIKRSLFGNYDYSKYRHIRYGEDLLQTIDIIKQNPKTVITEDKLYYYRMTPTSLTHSLNLERLVSDVMFVRNIAFDYLTGLGILNDEEEKNFIGYSIQLIANCASDVVRSRRTYADKKLLLNKIKESDYYKKISALKEYNKKALGNKRIVWFLFERNLYRSLNFMFKMGNFIVRN